MMKRGLDLMFLFIFLVISIIIFVLAAAPNKPTLNSPENNSVIGTPSAMLNTIVIDPDGDNMNVSIYANNNTNGLNDSEGLVYIARNVASGSVISYNLTASPVKSSDNGLVLLMHFDNLSQFGENETRVYDFSGTGNNGTVTGAAWNATGGKFAGAFYFNGSNYITIADNDTLDRNIGNTITYGGWFYFNNLSTDRRPLFKRDSYSFYWVSASNILSAWLKTNSSAWNQYLLFGQNLQANVWHHIIVTYNGTTVSAYIDGKINSSGALTGALNGSIYNSTYPLYLGGEAASNPIEGRMDDVAVWNRSLSQSEILNLYRLGDGRYYWRVNISDGANSNVSEVRSFIIDTALLINSSTATSAGICYVNNSMNISFTLNFPITNISARITNPLGNLIYLNTTNCINITGRCNLSFTSNMSGLYSVFMNFQNASHLEQNYSFNLTSKEKPTLTFVQLSDIHVGVFPTSIIKLNQTVEDINNQKNFPIPNFVVITGDIIDTGPAGNFSEYNDSKSVLDLLNTTYYPVIGNHETNWDPTDIYTQNYTSTFGSNKLNYTWNLSGYLFIALDDSYQSDCNSTSLLACNKSRARDNWLNATLEANLGIPTIIFSHVPFKVMKDDLISIMALQQNNFSGNLVDTLNAHKNQIYATFHGHDHINELKLNNSIFYVSTASLNTYPCTYRYVEVYPSYINVSSFYIRDTSLCANKIWTNTSDNYYTTSAAEAFSISKITGADSGFDGQSTNIYNLSSYNNVNLILEKTAYGKISFNNVNLARNANFTNAITISSNLISINSTALPELNTSATLALYNLSFINPRILKDGLACPTPLCSPVSYSNGIFTFGVTQFSTYSAGETPINYDGGYPNYQPTQQQLASGQGYEITLQKNWQVQLNVSNETHIVKLDDITNDTATITISSNPITFSVSVNETKKIDINGDNYYDLSVFLKNITYNGADLILKSIHEQIPSGETGAVSGTATNEEEKTIQIFGLQIRMSELFYAGAGIITIIIILIIFLFYKTKKK